MAFELEISYTIHLEGTKADAQRLRDKLDDLVYDAININCGSPDCCPNLPAAGEAHVFGAYGSSQIEELVEEE